jgi:hypothetical protein
LDWTIVRFLAPKDGPARGVVRQGFYGTDRLGFNVTRADIAAFTAAQIDDSATSAQRRRSATSSQGTQRLTRRLAQVVRPPSVAAGRSGRGLSPARR